MALPTPSRGFPDPNGSLFQDSWQIGGIQLANMARREAQQTQTPATVATTLLAGGMTIPALFPVTGIAVWVGATAGATYTIRHFSLVERITKNVIARTANSTTTPTANLVLTANLRDSGNTVDATYTPTVDTDVYVAIAMAATTAPTLMATPAGAASAVNFFTRGDPLAITATPTPTATPYAVGATLTVGTGQSQVVWCGLF